VINLPSRTDHRDGLGLAAVLTGIKVDWVPGVEGERVSDKVLPPGGAENNVSRGVKGSWRAHMDTLYRFVTTIPWFLIEC
jgi:hypothetical protein